MYSVNSPIKALPPIKAPLCSEGYPDSKFSRSWPYFSQKWSNFHSVKSLWKLKMPSAYAPCAFIREFAVLLLHLFHIVKFKFLIFFTFLTRARSVEEVCNSHRSGLMGSTVYLNWQIAELKNLFPPPPEILVPPQPNGNSSNYHTLIDIFMNMTLNFLLISNLIKY